MSTNGTTETDARHQVAEGLRAYADLIDANPDVPPPSHLPIYLWSGNKDEVIASLAAFARAMPKVDKAHSDYDFKLSGQLHGLEVNAHASRSTVCEKRTVTKTVDDWVCPDSLLEYAAAVDGQVPA